VQLFRAIHQPDLPIVNIVSRECQMECAYLTENAHRQWMMRNLAATGDQGQDIQRQRRWDEIRGRSPNNIKRREGPSGAEATSSSRTQRERHRTRGEERDGNGERKGTRQTRTGQWKTEWKELDRVGRPRRGNVTCPCPSAYSCLLSLFSSSSSPFSSLSL
jgi:hypothetical protein